MSTELGDSKPLTFNSPDLKWSEPTPAETATTPAVTSTATDATTDPSPADAQTPPVEVAPTPDAVAPPDRGPIPFERHEAILAKARQERDEEKAKWSRLEWADALVNAGKTPDQVRYAVGLLEGLDSDYVGTMDRLFRIAETNPELQAHVRSLAGRWLGQSVPGAPADTDPEPQPDFQESNTGKAVFSAERLQQWNDWRERRIEAKLTERFAPLVQSHEDAQRRGRAQAEYDRHATALKAEFDRYATKPHFQEHKAAILELIKASGWKMSIGDAYNDVLLTKVLPTASQTAKADQLADFQRQAHASSAKPSAGAVVTPVRYKSFKDIPADKW